MDGHYEIFLKSQGPRAAFLVRLDWPTEAHSAPKGPGNEVDSTQGNLEICVPQILPLNTLEILQISCCCKSFVIWNGASQSLSGKKCTLRSKLPRSFFLEGEGGGEGNIPQPTPAWSLNS